MNKIVLNFIFFVLIVGISVWSTNCLFAEEPNAEGETFIGQEISVPEALGFKNIGFLPNSPFYFLKEWWRGLKIGLLRSPIQKSESQLKISSEKLAEIEAMAQKGLKREVLEKAFDNYSLAMERLKERIMKLEETSENPNIDKLLDKIAEAEIRHQEVLDKILEQAPEMASQIQRIRQQITENLPFLRLRFENQEEFMNRLENKFQEWQPLNDSAAEAGEFLKLRIMEQTREQIRQAPLEDFPENVQFRAEQLQERLENQIQQRTQVLREKGFSSEEIESGVRGPIRVIVPMIPVERLPQAPPSGVSPPGNAPGHGVSGISDEIDFCIELWDPVCGIDGITYSNDCFAAQAGVEIQHQGECQ